MLKCIRTNIMNIVYDKNIDSKILSENNILFIYCNECNECNIYSICDYDIHQLFMNKLNISYKKIMLNLNIYGRTTE